MINFAYMGQFMYFVLLMNSYPDRPDSGSVCLVGKECSEEQFKLRIIASTLLMFWQITS